MVSQPVVSLRYRVGRSPEAWELPEGPVPESTAHDAALERICSLRLQFRELGARRQIGDEAGGYDFVTFNNRGVWHGVVGALRPTDRRVYHQCNLASSEPPLGPSLDA